MAAKSPMQVRILPTATQLGGNEMTLFLAFVVAIIFGFLILLIWCDKFDRWD